jgi:hypothetical protein
MHNADSIDRVDVDGAYRREGRQHRIVSAFAAHIAVKADMVGTASAVGP